MTIPRPAMDLAWVDRLDQADQRSFFRDLAAAAVAAGNGGGLEVVEACLREWRLTADALETAGLREFLREDR